ncbi:uncharacterized protein LOC135210290 [Macrobrachium nipponense]|uniref:uncharacterized protein LOC135210290 n=1 Tax=Macrobrachium nipponense TaxID=159736 RepID=UPI0030C8B4F6
MDLNPGNSGTISDYKTQFDRYSSCIKDIATPEVHRVFTWLYQGGKKYVGEYMKDIPGSMIHMNASEKKKLEDKMPTEEMDITMLYRFLQYTCGLSEPDKGIWNKPQDESQKKSLEHSLYQLKQKRNDLAHEDQKLKKMSNDELAAKMDEVKELCNIILKEAGSKSGKSPQDVALAIMELEENFQKTMGVTAALIAKLGRKEKQAANQPEMDFYVSPILTYKGKYLPLADIFTVPQANDTQGSIIFLTGDAGSGKSTLCEYLDWQWTNDKEEIQELQEYDLLLLIRCREVCTRDVVRLLKEDLLTRTMECCNPYRIPELIRNLKILWIIDGLEEATREATSLIRSLLSKDNYSSHSFLLASRPEFKYSIMQDLEQHEYTEVTLNGINPKDSFQSMVKFSQIDTDTSDLERFMSNFKRLDKNIQTELQNPLKLRVAIKFWSMTNRKSFKDSSLIELYSSLEESQIESLAKKLTGGMVTKDDATRKVKIWFDYLCQIAFELAAAKYILIINNATLDKLRRKCEELQIVLYSVCLSEFLTSNGQGSYQFLHSTQQYYFAAKYAADVWKASKGKANTMNLFDTLQKGTPQNSMLHFYEILLHMVSILQGSLDAVQVSNLIKLFQYTIDRANATPKWFEVIRKANYHTFFLETIGDIIPKLWFVSDQNIKEACCLIEYKQPEHIAIKLYNDPKNSGVEDLLYALAKAKSWIIVELYLEYHCRVMKSKDESDSLLKIICQESSKCCILGFSGHLSLEGCKILNMNNASQYCKALHLKVSSPQSLSTIYYHITKYELLANLQLMFTFLIYDKVNINSNTPTFKNTIVDLHFYNLIDNQVQNSVKVIQKLGKSFNSITVYKLSQSGATKFVQLLMQKEVKSNAFLRNIVDEDKGEIYLKNLGPLPLQYDIKHFPWVWVRSEKHR